MTTNLPSIRETDGLLVPNVDAPPPTASHSAPLLPQASTITVDLVGDSPLVLSDTQLGGFGRATHVADSNLTVVPVLSATNDTSSAGGVVPPQTFGMDRLIGEEAFVELPAEVIVSTSPGVHSLARMTTRSRHLWPSFNPWILAHRLQLFDPSLRTGE